MFLFVIVGIATVLALFDYGKIKTAVTKNKTAARFLPKAIGTVVITAQFSELLKTVEHVTIVNIAAALLLLAVILAAKAGTEGEELI